MLVYCTRCGEKQSASIETCFRCGFVTGERQKFDPFGRSQLQTVGQSNADDQDLYLFDFEEDVSFPVRMFFALTNPWRKRWRRGLVWRLNLVLLSFLILGLLGYFGNFVWNLLTDEEINNLFRTASRY
jgi:hypothetical protein